MNILSNFYNFFPPQPTSLFRGRQLIRHSLGDVGMNLYFICGFFKIYPRYILRSFSMYRGLFYENQILPFIYMCICINKKITARNTFVGFKQQQVIFKQRKRLHAKNISYSRLWWKKQQQKKYKKKLPWIVVFYQDSHRETGCRNLVQLELNRTTARQCFRLFLLCFIYTRYWQL